MEIVDTMQSASTKELATALSKAQAQIKGAIKGEENTFFKSRYADLASVWDAAREPLTKNGLSVVQTTAYRGDKLLLITTLLHNSGEWIRGEYLIKPVKEDPQGYGSATTYVRRYTLAAIVGISPEDDDGEASMARPTTKETIKEYKENNGQAEAPQEKSGKTSFFVKAVGVGAKGTTNGKPWIKYVVTSDKGDGYSTFKDEIAEDARMAMAENKQVSASWKRGQYGLELVKLEEAEAVPF